MIAGTADTETQEAAQRGAGAFKQDETVKQVRFIQRKEHTQEFSK